MIKIATIEDEENIRQEIVRYQDDEFKLKYNNIRDEKTNLTCDI